MSILLAPKSVRNLFPAPKPLADKGFGDRMLTTLYQGNYNDSFTAEFPGAAVGNP